MRGLRRPMTASEPRYEVAIVGSGFAGTILGRILHRLGRRVVILERSRHPRFALGESSTPLANLCLERLAQRYGLEDLDRIATYGRWLDNYPELGRGLKRGFTFYGHSNGETYRNSERNDRRLLVAASPNDASADSHWLRAELDQHLAELARGEGVELLERVELETVESQPPPIRLAGRHRGKPFGLSADLVIDGSGAAGFLARRLPIAAARDLLPFRSHLVFGHFEGLRPFAEIARETGASQSPGPYPEERAAVHHLFDDGWMYVLPFDDGLVSAGFVLRDESGGPVPHAEPGELWDDLLGRLPTVAAQFAHARPIRGPSVVPDIRYRRQRASGPGWALLPHAYAFYDPLYSTGIAWSLLGVERLASILEAIPATEALSQRALGPGLDRYERLLAAEADRIELLQLGAYRAMPDFELFTNHSFLYFAAVSWAETVQRLDPDGTDGEPAAWQGFLGVGDPVLDPLFPEAVRRLEGVARAEDRRAFADWIRAAIAPRNIAGLAEPARRNLYPADLELLVERASLLGRTRKAMRAALPRLLRSR